MGYPGATVEYALMRGTTGGSGHSESKAPTKFNTDKNVELIGKVFAEMPEVEKDAIAGVYLYRMPERRIALIIGTTRHVIRIRLYAGYQAVFAGLTTNVSA
jgi:hypothetical protein